MVTAIEVVEHISGLVDPMPQIVAWLKSEGVFFLTTANAAVPRRVFSRVVDERDKAHRAAARGQAGSLVWRR